MGDKTFLIGGDLSVRRIGYGGMSLTGPGGFGEPKDREGARGLLRRAVELGVQLFDTAASYGPHVSEELIAEALHPYPADVVVATKGGSIRTGPWQSHSDGSPENLRASCDGSLGRLRLERIDLYQLHAVDAKVPIEESVGALADLRAAGKIRHIGLSNVTVDQIDKARAVAPIVSVQNELNLATARAQDDVVDYCEREGLVYLPWRPLAKGSLSRGRSAVGAVANRHGARPASVALAWLLARSPVILPIPGTLSPTHLQENVDALSVELTEDDFAQLESFRLSALDARELARRFVPPKLRRAAVSVLRRG